MLVLSRKLMEKVYIGHDICITVVRLEGGQVRLGIEAPRHVPVIRAELQNAQDPSVTAPQPSLTRIPARTESLDDKNNRPSTHSHSHPHRAARLTARHAQPSAAVAKGNPNVSVPTDQENNKTPLANPSPTKIAPPILIPHSTL